MRYLLGATALALGLVATAPSLAMPPPPDSVVGVGKSGPTNVKVRRITEVTPISTTAPPPSVALKGKHRLLVVLVETADRPWPKKYSRARYQQMLFSKNTRSMREYYRENSYGQYDVDGQVVGPIRIPGRMRQYGFKMGQSNKPVQKLIKESVRRAGNKVNFTKFDTHDVRGKKGSDGILDHLMIVYPADTNAPNSFAPIWPHRGSMDFDAGRVRVNSYIVLNHGSPLGVFVHEYAHDIGLPDLYDRDYTSHGAGRWSLMASGSWAQAGALPSHLSAWGKARLGWVLPQMVTQNTPGLSVPAASEKPFALKLPIGVIDSREYFLIENRRRVGFDQGLPAEGIVIWHIDENKSHNDDERRKMVDVVEAAPVQDLDFLEQGRLPDHVPDVFSSKGKKRFDDNTTPSARTNTNQPTRIAVDVTTPPGRVMKINVTRPKIFNPGGVPYALERDSYRYGRFSTVPTGKGSEALVRFEATPGGYLVFGTSIFVAGRKNTRGEITVRIYKDARGKPGKALLTKRLDVVLPSDGYTWINQRLIKHERGFKLKANQRVWVGVQSDGKIYPALNPFSVSKTARFRRSGRKRVESTFNFRSGREPVSDYIVRLTGFGYVNGGGRPEPLATEDDPLVKRMKAADRLADAKKFEAALEEYTAIEAKMAKAPKRYETWFPVVVNSIGVAAYELKKYDVAIERFQMSLRPVQAAKDKPNEADIFENIGETAFFAKDYKEARTNCDRSRRINLTLGRKDRLVENLYWLGRALQGLELQSDAKAKLQEARTMADKAFSKNAQRRTKWHERIDLALKGKPKDVPKVKERIKEKLDADKKKPKDNRQHADLLQFLMDDVKDE